MGFNLFSMDREKSRTNGSPFQMTGESQQPKKGKPTPSAGAFTFMFSPSHHWLTSSLIFEGEVFLQVILTTPPHLPFLGLRMSKTD